MASTASPPFSKANAPLGVACCKASPCTEAKQKDDDLVAAVAARFRKLTGQTMVTEGKLPGDFGPKAMPSDLSPCQFRAYLIQDWVRRFNRYRQALPSARAAMDVNEVGDKPGNQSKGKPCLTRLPDDAAGLNKALGLKAGTITDGDLRNDRTGFRAAIYRSNVDGRLILVARDTEPHSMVDWETNIDNGRGKETAQYREMDKLSGKLVYDGVPFDLAGYSKGGGLAQEGGLVSADSRVHVFNSAGLPDDNLARTGNTSYNSLASRTTSFSAEDDFLTYMNNTTDPSQQIANAQFLRKELAGDGWPTPISLNYRNPETSGAIDAQQHLNFSYALAGIPPPAATPIDPSFVKDRDSFLKSIDEMIKNAQSKQRSGTPFCLFPPVHANDQETIPYSLSTSGQALGAGSTGPGLGKLAQHQMTNVLGPMEKLVDSDRAELSNFLSGCG